MSVVEECRNLIDLAWGIFEKIPLGKDMLCKLTDMKVRLEQPCVLAVAGKVKAGKSSFINALLGKDLAKVGIHETTATINRFCYGVPEDPDRPVKVVWTDHHETFETYEFMNSLQGNDDETLKKAIGIEYLEYRVIHPLLKELTLVDTPGTGAVVDEHQEATENFFKLRDKHQHQTEQCASMADAVVYLVGAVANIRDKSFLDGFKKSVKGGSTINAIGVLSKVDIDTNLLNNREEQSQYLANSLKDELSTVVPVSVGLYEAIVKHGHKFKEWQILLKSIPNNIFLILMMNDQLYLTYNLDSISKEQRLEIKSNLPWSVFRTIATELYNNSDVDDAKNRLFDIGNIENIKKLIKDYFFDRSKIIRCYRILSELKTLVSDILHLGLYKMREDSLNFKKWIEYVKNHEVNDSSISLIEYLTKQYLPLTGIEELRTTIINDLKYPIEMLQIRLRKVDEDYRMLKLLQSKREDFEDDEYDELHLLFRKKSNNHTNSNTKDERIQHWTIKNLFTTDNDIRDISQHAIEIYSNL